MPRKPRFNLIGIPQHIIQRGNNRESCFISKQDYLRFLQDLQESAHKYDCRIHAYVLMINHVHLLVTPMTDNGISHMMQALGRRYVYYFNKKYARTGTLWEGRYKSSLIDSEEYLLTCMRYIELNPVRANIVTAPVDYPWSSFVANARGDENRLLEPHPLYLNLGALASERIVAYRKLFTTRLEDNVLHDIRDSLNQELVLGRSAFKDKIEELTQRQTRLGTPGRPKVKESIAKYYVGDDLPY